MAQIRCFSSVDDLKKMTREAARISPACQSIARYIEKNYHQVVFMTSVELSVAIGISPGTVTRFFLLMGYRGYRDFQYNLRQFCRVNADRRQADYPLQPDDPRRHLIEQEVSGIYELGSVFMSDTYQELVGIMVGGQRKIVLLSAGASVDGLSSLEGGLKKMGVDVCLAVPDNKEWGWLTMEKPSAVQIVVVGFSRYPKILVEKCRQLRAADCFIIAITDTSLSPLAELSSWQILLPVPELWNFGSGVATLFFQILLQDVIHRLPGSEAKVEYIQELERKNQIYFTK